MENIYIKQGLGGKYVLFVTKTTVRMSGFSDRDDAIEFARELMRDRKPGVAIKCEVAKVTPTGNLYTQWKESCDVKPYEE